MITTNPRAKQQAIELHAYIAALGDIASREDNAKITIQDVETLMEDHSKFIDDAAGLIASLSKLRWNNKKQTFQIVRSWAAGRLVKLNRLCEEAIEDNGYNVGSWLQVFSNIFGGLYLENLEGISKTDKVESIDALLEAAKAVCEPKPWRAAGIKACAALKVQTEIEAAEREAYAMEVERVSEQIEAVYAAHTGCVLPRDLYCNVIDKPFVELDEAIEDEAKATAYIEESAEVDAMLLAEDAAYLEQVQSEPKQEAKNTTETPKNTQKQQQYYIEVLLGSQWYVVALSAVLGFYWSTERNDAHGFTMEEAKKYQALSTHSGAMYIQVLNLEPEPANKRKTATVKNVTEPVIEQETLQETMENTSENAVTPQFLMDTFGWIEGVANDKDMLDKVSFDLSYSKEEAKARVLDYFYASSADTHSSILSRVSGAWYWLKLFFTGTEFGHVLQKALRSMDKQSRKCRALFAADKYRAELASVEV